MAAIPTVSEGALRSYMEHGSLPLHIRSVKACYGTYIAGRNWMIELLVSPRAPTEESELKNYQACLVRGFNSQVKIFKILKEDISRLKARFVVDRTGAPTTGDAGIVLRGYYTLSQIEDNCDRLQKRLTDRVVTQIPHAAFLEKGLAFEYGDPMVSPAEQTQQHPSLRPYRREFPLYQPIRGDGNCFYTAFAMTLLQTQEGKDAFLAKLLSKAKLTPNETACHRIIDMINRNPHFAKTFWKDNKFMLPLAHFMRQEAATWMSLNPDEIQLHVLAQEAGLTIEQYLNQNVRKMGVEADDTVKTALSRAFNFPTETIDLGSKQRYPSHDDRESQLALARDGEHYFALLPQRA